GDSDIYVMDADGNNQIQLTSDANSERSPSWSPDGTKIAYCDDTGLYTVKADGSAKTLVTDNTSSASCGASWSPDGKTIAYFSNHSGNNEIFTIDESGDNLQNLTNHVSNDGYPTWSPDGTKIAFYSTRAAGVKIHVMDADGSNATLLTD